MRFFLFLLAASAAAQTTVTITGPQKLLDGTAFRGKLTIGYTGNVACAGVSVGPNVVEYAITADTFSIPVIPTAACNSGTAIKAVWTPSRGQAWTEYWVVPTSPSSQTVGAVKTGIVSIPAGTLSLSQLGFGSISAGQYIRRSVDGLSWEGAAGGGGGGGTGEWGLITGTITNQSDLVSALAGKAAANHNHTGTYEPVDAAILRSSITYTDPSWLLLTIGKVTGLSTALNEKALATHNHSGVYEPVDTAIIRSSTSYTNPSWLVSLAWSKITGLNGTPSSSTYLRGDGIWATPSGAGYVAGEGIIIENDTTIAVSDLTVPTYTSDTGAPTGTGAIGTFYWRTDTSQLYCGTGSAWALCSGTTYTLPTASAGTLGGVKVGSGLAIDGSGVLSTTGGGGTATGVWSSAIDFGSIPDLGCAESTFTASGLTAGRPLSLGSPASLNAGLQAFAIASATDTAKVRACNLSGAAVDPASGTFTVRDMGSLGQLSGSATIDFAAIPDGGCATNTITVTGAAGGDTVSGGAPAGLESGLYPGWVVTATNTVTVTLCNLSGASVNPASGTFTAVVTKN